MRAPTTVKDRHDFHTLIDARSPAEYAIDHIPGAINCPVLDDAQRVIVGTLYKQQGAFEARRVGGATFKTSVCSWPVPICPRGLHAPRAPLKI